MAKTNTSITLGEEHREFINRQVASGRYASASEVIRDALRLAEVRERKAERLRQLVREGEESGIAEPFNWDAFMAEQFPDA